MMLTIFTPTYNRAPLLPRLYESLLGQDDRDFEWLVVDDGSTDGTASFMQRTSDRGTFPIRYVQKPNGGKHTAHNEALRWARGEWFLCLDSDDVLAPGAVSALRELLGRTVPGDCGILALKALPDGSLLGTVPDGWPDSHLRMQEWYRRGAGGEYAIALRTAVLRDYPFPEIPGERFMGECVLYDRLELEGYTLCASDRVLEICEYQADGLSGGSPYRMMMENPVGYQLYHAQRIDLAERLPQRLRHCISYQAFAQMSGDRARRYRGKRRWLAAAMWLPGRAAMKYYQSKGKRTG